MQLTASDKFLNDYKKYQEIVSKIDNKTEKVELQKLINSLFNEAKRIDSCHSELLIKNSISSTVIDSRNNLISIRKKIEKKISDCEKAGLIKK